MFNKKQKELTIAYMDTFNSEHGKKVLQHLMSTFFCFHSTIGDTPEETAYNEGARSVVLRILKTINQDPSRFEQMLKDEGQSKE